ncbi:hypothetical protein HYQ45_002703 [Verticillium longisporum]|uniref:Cupin type-1 domain-containing protein n=1 Tax=Verticillium longisporum TaxID=100787 RepID=A0A8I2ZYM9_VERLO|nr:hypothetical protein HYQ45_002703 [Verticillium longisporum]
MAALNSQPEQYHIKPTAHCPNNVLPVLVYRDVLPRPHNAATTSEALEKYGWEKRGTFGTIIIKHFHPNTHECYGVTCRVYPGDVIVVPAGVAHASVPTVGKPKVKWDLDEDELHYQYIGVYPGDGPIWKVEHGKEEVSQNDPLIEEIALVDIPADDPISGPDGPLCQI